MSILSDKWIREAARTQGMIEPFVEAQRRDGCISYGLSSYGYDARVAPEFKIFTNVDSAVVDPKDFAANSFVDRETDVCIIPPNSFALARTVEYFRIPRDVLVIFEHHSAARQNLCQRRRVPVPVPAGERTVRDELRRPRRQIYGATGRHAAQAVVRSSVPAGADAKCARAAGIIRLRGFPRQGRSS